MKKELDQLLCDRYPKIFADRHGSATETLMCWGFECGDGWFNIIDKLCANIQNHIDWRNKSRERLLESNPHNVPILPEIPQVVAVQVKEKFGTLRFYYDGGDDYIRGLAAMADSMSAVTCEECGKPGTRRGRNWLYTACDEHTREEDKITDDYDE